MANTTARLIITELDPDTIKQNLITFLQSQDKFRDYNFEGSGLNILLDVLAYNDHYLAYYINMAVNESFADTALMPDSIRSKAKELGYLPRSRAGAIANVSLTVTPPISDTTVTQTLPRYTKFISSAIDGTNYIFSTLDDAVATRANTSVPYVYSSLSITQGRVFRFAFPTVDLGSNPKLRFVLPDSGVDTGSIAVAVQQSASNLSSDIYNQTTDVNELTPDSLVYFLEPASNQRYALQFGDGVLGKKLANGNIVIVNYLVSDGDISNGADLFTYYSGSGFSAGTSYSVSTIDIAAGGNQEEGIEEIRFNSLRGYANQNRAVTTDDYETLIVRDYPYIDAISVWGGQDNVPPIYGYVFVSMKPRDGFILSTAQKNYIAKEIIGKRNVVTVTPRIVDPEYTFIRCAPTVRYDSRKTTLSTVELATVVRSAILAYSSGELGKFNQPFRLSELNKAIVDSSPAFLGSDMNVIVEKQLDIQPGVQHNYEIDFGCSLHHGSITERLYVTPAFNMNDGFGVSRLSYLEETPGSESGIYQINVDLPGSGYTNPTVTITGDAPSDTIATATATVVNGQITSINIDKNGQGYSFAQVVIDDPTGSGAQATAVLSNNRGVLRSYYFADGKKIILNDNAGLIEYDTGKVTLSNFGPSSLDGAVGATTMSFIATSEDDTIIPERNKIITINQFDQNSIRPTIIKEI